jgi:hypothetical protein
LEKENERDGLEYIISFLGLGILATIFLTPPGVVLVTALEIRTFRFINFHNLFLNVGFGVYLAYMFFTDWLYLSSNVFGVLIHANMVSKWIREQESR